ncbi:MAG: SPOR domain-containing protein [Candidatus Marinimicrobia bacterium]|nr:SPOR domain-containing protein [Candidatus Neomarinimicrobiota bacterium]MCF7829715.1 SPOR domain-containing protein [Candidatus Neomarinimicrobiota bacterium]MCF7881665.1 SPOR domain-containing protein [Candidatus Neomarinimicrobiota bacterium]
MKTRIISTIAVFGLFLLTATAVTAQSESGNQYDESFDPLKLNEPSDTFFQEESRQESLRQMQEERLPLPSQEEQHAEQSGGYRVQLVATPNYQEADSLLSDVRDQFEAQAKAYLIYDSPNYKVRVGNCQSRNEAEALLQVAKQMGFRYAWIVRSTIYPDEKIWNASR